MIVRCLCLCCALWLALPAAAQHDAGEEHDHGAEAAAEDQHPEASDAARPAMPAMPAEDHSDSAAEHPPEAEPETVLARRLNDSVAVRFAADGRERNLYFFDSRAELSAGDEIEQGPSGQTTVIMAEGGLLEMYASGHLIIDALGMERDGELLDVLRFPLVTTAELTSGLRKIRCVLPGGSQAEFIDGRITISVVPGRLRIRNEGGNPVEVRGLLTEETHSQQISGEGLLVLGRGDEVAMPYFGHRNRRLGDAGGNWAGLSLREMGSLEVEHDAQHLVVTAPVPEEGLSACTVGGVRARIPAGASLVFERQRRGAPSIVQVNGQTMEAAVDPGREAPAPVETPPPGMSAIALEQYAVAVEKGHTVEELAALGYWVSPSVQAAYEASQHPPEGDMPGMEGMDGHSASGDDAPAADELDADPHAGHHHGEAPADADADPHAEPATDHDGDHDGDGDHDADGAHGGEAPDDPDETR